MNNTEDNLDQEKSITFSEDEDDENNDLLIDGCIDMIHSPSLPRALDLHVESQLHVPHLTPLQTVMPLTQLQPPPLNYARSTPPTTNLHVQVTPQSRPLPYRSPSINTTTPRNVGPTPIAPSNSWQTPNAMQSRTQFGGKCPRKRQLDLATTEDSSNNCSSCKNLKREIERLKSVLATYEAHNDESPPKPGKVQLATANYFKMIELSPGSGVFVFDKHIEQAVARKSATSCASFLLNCFYNNAEMEGMNLTGANGKLCPDKDIIESIIAFTIKKHVATTASLKAALRNKMAANNSRAAGKNPC